MDLGAMWDWGMQEAGLSAQHPSAVVNMWGNMLEVDPTGD